MILTYCPYCRLPGGDALNLCPSCNEFAKRDMFDSFMIRCPVCFHPLVSPLYICPECGMRIFSIFDYSAPFMRRIMEDWKFNGNRKLSPLIGNYFAKALSDLGLTKENCCLVKVPSTRKHDQMDDIMHFLGRRKGYGICDIIVCGRKHASEQKTLNREQRLEQASKKFFLRPSYVRPGKITVILDDITTTGASLKACRNLLENNSIEVWGAVTLLQEL